MADTMTKVEVEALVERALAKQAAAHQAELETLRNASLKTDLQKQGEAQMLAHRAKQAELLKKAIEVQGAGPTLKYVVGPSGAYHSGQILKPGDIATCSSEDNPKFLPSAEWEVYDKGGKAKAAPIDKKAPMTASEMNKADAERPKHGALASKKGHRPSDTEV